MRVTLLGTGSADGWPNPFCTCPSCTTERSARRSRRPSAALIDGRILVDCGPTTPHLPGGTTLATVEHLLVTHAHPDHLNPAVLLTRAWVAAPTRLHVWAPERAADQCRPWLGPDADVEIHVVEPGTDVRLTTGAGHYGIHVLPAEHHHGDGDELALEAVLYVITDPHGDRLMYAVDTGPLPPTTIAAVGGRVDLLVIDETFGDHTAHARGHLDLESLPRVLASLRAASVVDETTTVAVTHLSHHNPPTPVLRERLREHAVIVPDDFDVLDTTVPGGRPPRRSFVLGGVRSGKSTFAEASATPFGAVHYVATGGERSNDPEWRARIADHRARRPSHWRVHETTDIVGVLDAAVPGDCVLVDCLTLWLTDVLDGADAWSASADRDQVATVVDQAVTALVSAICACAASVILVSNEVGLGVVPSTASGRLFADHLGRVNARVADACDDVTLLVAGRPIDLTSKEHP